jgi:prolyl 4-hydroxylase
MSCKRTHMLVLIALFATLFFAAATIIVARQRLRQRTAVIRMPSVAQQATDVPAREDAAAGIAPRQPRPTIFTYTTVHSNGTMRVRDAKGAPQFDVRCRVLSAESPRVIVCDDFASAAECEALIALGAPELKNSGVAGTAPGKAANRGLRTSYGARLPAAHPVVKRVDRRMLSLVNLSGRFAERLYLLRYEKGQRYVQHTDDFGGVTGAAYVAERRARYRRWVASLQKKRAARGDAAGVSSPSTTADGKFAAIDDGKEFTSLDRAATMLLYLRTMPPGGGGNTSFPRLRPNGTRLTASGHPKKGHRRDAPQDAACDPSEHLTVAPVRGRLLLFYSLHTDGTFDRFAAHAGCAVLGDTAKYTITKWLMVPLP